MTEMQRCSVCATQFYSNGWTDQCSATCEHVADRVEHTHQRKAELAALRAAVAGADMVCVLDSVVAYLRGQADREDVPSMRLAADEIEAVGAER